MVTSESILHDAVRASGGHARPPAGPSDHVDGLAPAVVVEPTTVDEVSATLAWASANGLSVVLRGAGSKDSWGRPPRPVDVLLRTGRMNRVIAHESADLTATVEAGARLIVVNQLLGRHGQYLPIDPSHGQEATIGGLLATNDTGPLRHRFGTPRDLLIGMTIVMADGSVSSSGGRVVKNVAGYDIGRLMTGSHGALAAIVGATFKLSPRPPATRTVRVPVARASDVVAFADLRRHHQSEPEALEVHVSRRKTGERIEMLARYGSVPAAVEDGCRQAMMCAQQIGVTTAVAEGPEEAAWWAAHDAAAGPGHALRLRLSWRPSEFERASAALASATRGADVEWRGRAAVGTGVVDIGGDLPDPAAVVGALRTGDVFRHVVIVGAPADLRRTTDVWEIPDTQQTIWKALKTACDPRDTLGAGRGPL
jgi:glycolate oxidase FAD binding subunit